jgi:hypothetical protein
MKTVWKEIKKERKAQDKKWGGPGHDDRHTSHDWVSYLTKHVGKAVMFPWDKTLFRNQMVRVAAVAVAAIEWCDRDEIRLRSSPTR